MPRILGVDIPNDKRTIISLRYIYGIGPFLAEQLCERASVDPDKRARELTEDERSRWTFEGRFKAWDVGDSGEWKPLPEYGR